MKGGVCGTLVKYLVLITNLLVFLVSAVALGFGFYSLGQNDDASSATSAIITGGQQSSLANDLLNTRQRLLVIIGASAVALIVSFLGCCGAAKENRFVMWIYFVVMLLVSYLTISWGTLVVTPANVESAKTQMLESMKSYNPNATDETAMGITDAWDNLQTEFSCCGVFHPSDWYNQSSIDTIFPSPEGSIVPKSCCDESQDCNGRNVNDAGCYDSVVEEMVREWENVGIVVGVVAGVMLINMMVVFTFALMMGKSKKDVYQPVP